MATDFGTDISTFLNGDLDPNFTLISGKQVVGEAIARRFLTQTGSLSYAPNYGFDVRMLLNDSLNSGRLAALSAQMETEALKDERVQTCTITSVYNSSTQILTITANIVTADGPFQFTLSVSQYEALLGL